MSAPSEASASSRQAVSKVFFGFLQNSNGSQRADFGFEQDRMSVTDSLIDNGESQLDTLGASINDLRMDVQAAVGTAHELGQQLEVTRADVEALTRLTSDLAQRVDGVQSQYDITVQVLESTIDRMNSLEQIYQRLPSVRLAKLGWKLLSVVAQILSPILVRAIAFVFVICRKLGFVKDKRQEQEEQDANEGVKDRLEQLISIASKRTGSHSPESDASNDAREAVTQRRLEMQAMQFLGGLIIVVLLIVISKFRRHNDAVSVTE